MTICLIFFYFSQCFAIDEFEKIETIIEAKMVISGLVSHNPTLTFYDESTIINSNVVTLKFSFQDKRGIIHHYILNVILVKGEKNEKTV